MSAPKLRTNSTYSSAQCFDVKSGLHSDVRAQFFAGRRCLNITSSLKRCTKPIFCFYDLAPTISCHHERHHNAPGERMSIAKSARRALLCAVAGHLCYLIASGRLRSSSFSASIDTTCHALNRFGASGALQDSNAQPARLELLKPTNLRPALNLGAYRCHISASSPTTRNQLNLLRNSKQQCYIRPSFGRPRSCSCSISCGRRCRGFTSRLLRRKPPMLFTVSQKQKMPSRRHHNNPLSGFYLNTIGQPNFATSTRFSCAFLFCISSI